MIFDDHLYLDRVQLAARGWTRSLTERFLPNPDRWMSVKHWRNYTGRATYFVEKVMVAEQLTEFKKAFASSITRRGPTQAEVNVALGERARVEAMYRAWLKTLSSDDVRTMVVIESAAAELESARSMGYRTPHK